MRKRWSQPFGHLRRESGEAGWLARATRAFRSPRFRVKLPRAWKQSVISMQLKSSVPALYGIDTASFRRRVLLLWTMSPWDGVEESSCRPPPCPCPDPRPCHLPRKLVAPVRYPELESDGASFASNRSPNRRFLTAQRDTEDHALARGRLTAAARKHFGAFILVCHGF